MDSTDINTIVGIAGVIVGIVSIIIAVFVKSKKVITISSKSKLYLNKADCGQFKFDYSNNDGVFTIGSGDYAFDTKWSGSSNISIHAYKDCTNVDSIALIENVIDINAITNFECDFSSRVRTAKIGDAILWKNTKGKCALTKILSIKARSHGAEKDEIECEYVIYK